jgi:hypothetical protein
MGLEKRVNEGGYCGGLSEEEQQPEKDQHCDHGDEPPELASPEKDEYFTDDAQPGKGLSHDAH